MKQTHHYASFLNERTGRVRHLLIDEVDGRMFTDLIVFAAGGEETIASGTEYETRQKADQFGQSWSKEEGFKRAKNDDSVFEPLQHAIKLAMRLGHDAIYDARAKQMDPRKGPINGTGLVLLKEWSGMQAKNGGSYGYAVTLSSIIAQPQIPAGYSQPASLSDPQRRVEIYKALETVGPRGEFLFAGMTLVD